jgi:hypothetical protein
MVDVFVLGPPGPYTVSVTVYTPGAVYVVEGFASTEPELLPKLQFWEVMVPVDVLVNCTTSGAHPLVGEAVKFAVCEFNRPPAPSSSSIVNIP